MCIIALIRPCADLRNNYNKISKICHELNEPMYITRNGTNDLVVLSDKLYESIIKKSEQTEEERIEKLVAQHFDKQFATFEEFKTDLIKQIEKAQKQIKEGKYQTMESFCAEMEAKYDIT